MDNWQLFVRHWNELYVKWIALWADYFSEGNRRRWFCVCADHNIVTSSTAAPEFKPSRKLFPAACCQSLTFCWRTALHYISVLQHYHTTWQDSLKTFEQSTRPAWKHTLADFWKLKYAQKTMHIQMQSSFSTMDRDRQTQTDKSAEANSATAEHCPSLILTLQLSVHPSSSTLYEA